MDPLLLLAPARRRVIMRICWDGERSVGEIHAALGDVTFGAVSQQLKLLADAGLLFRREDGQRRLYQARKETLGPLRKWLEGMWATALDELALRAEMEDGRRGPRPRRRRRKS